MKLRTCLSFPLLMAIFMLLAGCTTPSEELDIEPEAVAGLLDLSKLPADNTTLFALNGEWSFYWNQLLEPRDVPAGRGQQTGYIEMPSNWYKYTTEDGSNLPLTGFATFVLDMKIPHSSQTKGILVPPMYSNYNLWVNNQLLAVSGHVGASKEQSIPQKDTRVIYFDAPSGNVQLVLQISNYHNYAGGMFEPLLYGPAPAIQKNHDRNLAVQFILFGILLLSGIYHIGLSFFRNKDTSMLYFGLFCSIVALRNTLVGEVFFTKVFPDFPWEIAMKIEYICLYSMVPLFALFLQRLFPAEASALFSKISVILAAIYAIVTIAVTANVYYLILLYYQIFIVISFVYAIYLMIRAIFYKRDGAIFALVGFSAFVLTSLFDLSGFVLQRHSWQSFHSLGVATFIVCFSLVLSRKLSTSFNMAEQLAQQLTELNESLDKKVRERTLVIEESNKKLEELNRQLQEWSLVDGLTNVSNRRHFDEYLSNQLLHCAKKNTPLTLLLIDIDYFKLYNDANGHIQGDHCLQEVARAIKASLSPHQGLAARYGGEEFAVVLPSCNKENALAMAQILCTAIRDLHIPHSKSLAADHVTVSIGVATIQPGPDTNHRAIIDLADQNLYKAKSMGRNRVCANE
ncbi:diguanylate cyclase [Paenibacillus oenotherae]|uniref:Diguanylate cyclase n=1 Tax=Paenibacillus oenotherae TaxID=1435645 RepID=A0ABS7D5G2_9BACL|nr:diguanylate cyclase [Paenibacillus oenotherae]MBW7475177.1 diguanylate cyclase [Paenibacillus oenotherae]